MNYEKEALRTEAYSPTQAVAPLDDWCIKHYRLLHAAIGCCTEAGELLDVLKKNIFYRKPIDEVNVIEELGDIFWYLAVAANALGVSFEEIQARNIAKLKARYPEKFTEHHAEVRNLDAERKALEGK